MRFGANWPRTDAVFHEMRCSILSANIPPFTLFYCMYELIHMPMYKIELRREYETLQEGAAVRTTDCSHWLRLNYYAKKCGGIGSNGFQIK